MAAQCAVCGAAGRLCARCGLDAYCGKEHQRQDWPRHKLGCRKAGSGLDSLPEELLHRVLSLVPLESLLALRLVCRRWARAVLTPAVWRHRRLDLNKQPDGLGLLRLAPVLDELSVYAAGLDDLQVDGPRDYKTTELPILKALADSPCEFRSLRVFTSASPAACRLMVSALERRRTSLRKLNLELVPYDVDYFRYGFASVLAAVDAMENLDWLALGWEYCGLEVSSEIKYSFQRLSSLRCLWLQDGLHPTTIRSLLVANKQSLREVNCGSHDVMQMLVEEVPSVRTVRGRGISESIHRLRHLTDLELLDVSLGSDLDLLAQFLERSPRVPKHVKLWLGQEEFCEWDARCNMPRVTYVRVGVDSSPLTSRPPSATLSLPHVEVLQIVLVQASSPNWAAFKAMLVASSAPKLRELHLLDLSLVGLGMDPAWLAQMRAQRPHLKVCSGYVDMLDLGPDPDP